VKVMIDLCCGLGGASQAFWDANDWLVLRIDNNEELLPYVKGLILTDVTDFENTTNIINALMPDKVDKLVIWASPPCLEFSLGFSGPRNQAYQRGEEFEPSFEIVEACIDIINHYQPHAWWMENVRGAITYFTPEFGPYRQKLGQFFLWGEFPLIAVRDSRILYHTKPDKRHHPLRANIRAMIPEELSIAVKESIDVQRTLF
jgi:site-specific DNA-cytosine methylase